MKISVIVCTRNRAYAIVSCLDSIVYAMKNANDFETELVIVNNGSTDRTTQIIHEWSVNCGAIIHLVEEPRKGLSVARNAAIKVASGDMLIFTDDDCVMDKDYIVTATRHFQADVVPTIRGGRTELGDPSDLPLTIKTDGNIQRKQMSTDSETSRYISIGNMVFGCNMILPQSVVSQIGSFDERLGAGTNIPGGEETDYLYRAYLKNIPIEYTPDLVVHHFHGRKTVEEGFNLAKGYSIGGGALYMKYAFINPKLCRPFYWDIQKAFKEVIEGRNNFMPFINFSYRDMIVYNVKGIFLFMAALCKGRKAHA